MIVLRGVRKQYLLGGKSIAALSGVDLTIRDGEFVSITGPTGCGKTTLMNIIGCMEPPTSGSYLLDGAEVGHLPPDDLAPVRNQKFGIMLEGSNLVGHLPVIMQVEMPLLYEHALDRRQRARAALQTAGMSRYESYRPHQLSIEQQQRVTIARTLVCRPAILLAEEPTGTLDGEAAASLMRLLAQLNGERQITVIVVTCKQEIAEYARRVVTLRDGTVLSDQPTGGTPRPETASVALPIAGIAGDPQRAWALQQLLQAADGVRQAYVSPATALAYVEFLPARVTEEQLAQLAAAAGYQINAAAQPFDWRRPPERARGPAENADS